MQSALQDLEALMIKAKDMVRLAAELNEKLTAASTSKTASHTPALDSQSALSSRASPSPSHSPAPFSPINEPEEATFIRSSLSQLGLQMSNAPVTLDMIKDERKWVEELARELAGVLQGSNDRDAGGIMRDRGIIALDEVWGGWNRARGVGTCPFCLLLAFLITFVAHIFSTDTAPKPPPCHSPSSAVHDAPPSDTHAVVGTEGAAHADVFAYGFCGAVEWDAGDGWSEDDG